jgi:hypothetical protein
VGLEQLQTALQAALRGRKYKYVPEAITYTSSSNGSSSSSSDGSSGSNGSSSNSTAGGSSGAEAAAAWDEAGSSEADGLPEGWEDMDEAQLLALLDELEADEAAAEMGPPTTSAAPATAAPAAARPPSGSSSASGSSGGKGWRQAEEGDEGEVELAPADDEDLWLLGLSEEELLQMEMQA